MDDFDHASLLEEQYREAAIEAVTKQARKPSRDDCVECFEPIPEQRKAVGGIERCISCQTILESK